MASAQKKLLLPGRDATELELTFAGNVVKHLGVQMYAGRPVPAIAELISNAWDADATKVEVAVPLDEPWDQTNPEQYIKVSDNGNGMNWEMVRDAYLDVGRDRREAENTDNSPGGRKLQGRKGVGKLAGFGIADTLEVQTVHDDPDPSIGKRAVIWFKLELAQLKKAKKDPATVDLIYAGPTAKAPQDGRKAKGTTVILRNLHERRAQNADRFHHSMAQRFLLIGPKFRVLVNDEALRDEDIELDLRYPTSGWETDDVPGCGPVNYWIGFTNHPRQQNAGELSGILIYTRQKVSQEATFFDISGGVTGQHGLRYMVGKVRVEWLDDTADLIATHRGSIAWESPQGVAFQEWGQNLIKKLLAEWANHRMRKRVAQIHDVSPKLSGRIDRLAPAYKDVALQFVDRFKSVEMEPSEFEDILSWFLDALENATLRSILERLRSADISDLTQLDELLNKMEVRTAVTLLQIIDSNLAAIETLEKMHTEDAKERGVLSKHVQRNPWLIDVTWMLNKAEARVATWIRKEFGLPEPRGDDNDDRVDFFCVAVGGTLHIVEIKRGRFIAKEKEILQADKYRQYVLKRFQEITDSKGIKYHHVESHLIAAELHKDARVLSQTYANAGFVFFTTWDDLIERAKRSHQQFRTILEHRAESLDAAETSESRPKTRRKAVPKSKRKLGKRKAPVEKRTKKKPQDSKTPTKKRKDKR